MSWSERKSTGVRLLSSSGATFICRQCSLACHPRTHPGLTLPCPPSNINDSKVSKMARHHYSHASSN